MLTTEYLYSYVMFWLHTIQWELPSSTHRRDELLRKLTAMSELMSVSVWRYPAWNETFSCRSVSRCMFAKLLCLVSSLLSIQELDDNWLEETHLTPTLYSHWFLSIHQLVHLFLQVLTFPLLPSPLQPAIWGSKILTDDLIGLCFYQDSESGVV